MIYRILSTSCMLARYGSFDSTQDNNAPANAATINHTPYCFTPDRLRWVRSKTCVLPLNARQPTNLDSRPWRS
jgi:hypothetical protein